MLAYFLNKFLAKRRKAAGEKDFLNSKELYRPGKSGVYFGLFGICETADKARRV